MREKAERVFAGCFELFVEWLHANPGQVGTTGYYSERLTLWLLACQRLMAGASLARTLDVLSEDAFLELAGECKRRADGHRPINTGGFSRARSKLKVETVAEVCDTLFGWLQNTEVGTQAPGNLYSLDGSSVELLHSDELAREFPTHANGHYPLMRIVVCHDLESGLALRPEYAAMYGEARQGEIQLGKSMLERLPAGATVVGDRNFGIFSMAYHAQKQGLKSIFRLQSHRAKKILGKEPAHGTVQDVQWRPTRQDLKANPEIPEDAVIEGRVICMNVKSYKGDKVTPLFLFTTRNDTTESIIEMYGKRWQIEVDLRTLKQTVSLEMLKVKSVAMAEKELLVGVCAYNLICTVRRNAAKELGLDPRQISFTRMLHAVPAFAQRFAACDADDPQREKILADFERLVKAAKHPNRTRKRTEPRALVRRRRQKYPSMKTSRKEARENTRFLK